MKFDHCKTLTLYRSMELIIYSELLIFLIQTMLTNFRIIKKVEQDVPIINFINASKIEAAGLLDAIAISCTLIRLPHVHRY